MSKRIVQGDAFTMPVILRDRNGLLDVAAVARVEFMFGDLRKVYPDGVSYDGDRGVFLIPFSQEETFALRGAPRCQARVQLLNGSVHGTAPCRARVEESISKEVL